MAHEKTSEITALTERPGGSDPSELFRKRLPLPSVLLDLVNEELRGNLDEPGMLALKSDPIAWLNTLYTTWANVREQIRERDERVERELSNPKRSVSFDHERKRHSSWKRKVQHFEKIVTRRIDYVRTLIPSDDLRALLFDGASIDPENPEAIRVWQAKVKTVISR